MKKHTRKEKQLDTTTGQGKFKPRDTCKGKREHEYILVLPDFIQVTDDVSPDLIEEYYLSEERRIAFEKSEDEKLMSLGLKKNYWSGLGMVRRRYRCIICDKKKHA